MVPTQHYLILAAILFCFGMFRRAGAAQRAGGLHVHRADAQRRQPDLPRLRPPVRRRRRHAGPRLAFFIIAVAAAEAAIGLAIVIAVFRSRGNVNADEIRTDEALSIGALMDFMMISPFDPRASPTRSG